MVRHKSFRKDENCAQILKRADDKQGIIKSPICAFDDFYGLTSKKVTFKCLPDRVDVKHFDEEVPKWWNSYNDVKHDIT
jgi:hypothetical protein